MHIIVGITGASGSLLAKTLIENITNSQHSISLVSTENGQKVFAYETGVELLEFIKDKSNIQFFDNKDMFATIASGSVPVDAMIILPCSMSTIAKIANGISDTLLLRAADVSIKENRKLILVPRESPLSSIHINNMLTASKCGCTIIPPMPQFYSFPQSIEDVVNGIVGRILQSCGLENNLYKKWRLE